MPSAISPLAEKYRGATVEDLDPPPALSVSPHDPISHALMASYENDYTHLTITSPETRALLGYLSIPRLRDMITKHEVRETNSVESAMQRFVRRGRVYKVITPDTPLEELELFFDGTDPGNSNITANGTFNDDSKGSNFSSRVRRKQDFAVVTDDERKFVLGVVTREDLDEFVRRRPGSSFV
ncbi:MAG: hypothetical protein M1828_004250 [Chrysothrix sp. TS-e1954]|nr:MAG: hypothetical protein M1828_004250 [Chrysothrix sp. TS-e1954]